MSQSIERILALFTGNVRDNVRAMMSQTPNGEGSPLPIQLFRMQTMAGGPYHLHDPTTHCILCAMLIEADKPWKRLAALLHDIGKAETQTFDEQGVPHFYGHEKVGADIAQAWFAQAGVDAWEAAGVPVRLVVGLVREHMFDLLNVQERRVRGWLREFGEEFVLTLADLRLADWQAGRTQARELELARSRRDWVRKYVVTYREQIEREAALRAAGKCVSVADLAVNGHDLIAVGMKPGPGVGAALAWLMGLVNEGRVANSSEALLSRAREALP